MASCYATAMPDKSNNDAWQAITRIIDLAYDYNVDTSDDDMSAEYAVRLVERILREKHTRPESPPPTGMHEWEEDRFAPDLLASVALPLRGRHVFPSASMIVGGEAFQSGPDIYRVIGYDARKPTFGVAAVLESTFESSLPIGLEDVVFFSTSAVATRVYGDAAVDKLRHARVQKYAPQFGINDTRLVVDIQPRRKRPIVCVDSNATVECTIDEFRDLTNKRQKC